MEKDSEYVPKEREVIFSKAVRAGKRTYFFDVKSTIGGDYYLIITESKKRFNREGQSFYEKHKIFLFKEDFDKYIDSLVEIIEYIKTNNPISISVPTDVETNQEYSHVEFEDLEKKDNGL